MQNTLKRSTPAPWALRGFQIRADDGRGAHVGTYQISLADGKLMAAAPRLFRLLLIACSSLDAIEKSARSHCTADDIRMVLIELGLIVPGIDEHGRPSEREDPIETITGDEV